MTELRVAYVLKMFPRFSETFVLGEMLELERQGIDLRVFSLKRPDDGLQHGEVARLRAPVTYMPETIPRLLLAQRRVLRRRPRRYLRQLARVLARRRRAAIKHFLQAGAMAPDLEAARISHVHAHFATAATSVAGHLQRLTGVPYSFTAHAKDIYRHTVRPGDLARKLREARFAVTVSDFNKRHLALLAPPGRVVRIYNGLDLDLFRQNGVHKSDPPLVLAVGRLVEKKGFGDLVRACSFLVTRNVRFRCAIAGKGELEDALRRRVQLAGLEHMVELLGPVPREHLLALYGRASVLAAPCIVGDDGNRDGLPTVLVEAMALGVPVVATDVTGIPELVEDGVTGLLVPQHRPDLLADALERLLTHPELGSAIGGAARTRVERQFDVRRNAGHLRVLLEASAR